MAALASRMTGRPVKLALNRRQMFLDTGHRPRTDQRIAIGALPDGKLVRQRTRPPPEPQGGNAAPGPNNASKL